MQVGVVAIVGVSKGNGVDTGVGASDGVVCVSGAEMDMGRVVACVWASVAGVVAMTRGGWSTVLSHSCSTAIAVLGVWVVVLRGVETGAATGWGTVVAWGVIPVVDVVGTVERGGSPGKGPGGMSYWLGATFAGILRVEGREEVLEVEAEGGPLGREPVAVAIPVVLLVLVG